MTRDGYEIDPSGIQTTGRRAIHTACNNREIPMEQEHACACWLTDVRFSNPTVVGF